MLKRNSTLVAHLNHIVELAGVVALEYHRKSLEVEFKEDESPVTQADKAVEMRIRSYLEKHFPDDRILGEEFGLTDEVRGDDGHIWCIDPIDGTRSFLSGHPLFGFLLARLLNGVPEIGVVGMPKLSETIIGCKDVGTTFNGKQIFTSNQTSLDQAILYINEGEKLLSEQPAVLASLTKIGQTRRFAYDCYPHALLAMGHVDIVIDYDLQPYDYLPLVPVVEAAGGVVTDWRGNSLTMASGGTAIVSAATIELHSRVLKELRN